MMSYKKKLLITIAIGLLLSTVILLILAFGGQHISTTILIFQRFNIVAYCILTIGFQFIIFGLKKSIPFGYTIFGICLIINIATPLILTVTLKKMPIILSIWLIIGIVIWCLMGMFIGLVTVIGV